MMTEAHQDMAPVEAGHQPVEEAEHLRVQEAAHLATEHLEIGDHLRTGEEAVTGEHPEGTMVMPLPCMMNNCLVLWLNCCLLIIHYHTI